MKRPIPDWLKTSTISGATVLLGVRGYHQMDNFSCGPAAVHTVVKALGMSVWESIDNACPIVGMDTKLVRLNLSRFVESYVTGNSLRNIRQAIDNGDMIVCTTPLPWQRNGDTHWVVVVGYRGNEVLVTNYTGLPGCTKRWIPAGNIDSRTLTVCSTGLCVDSAAGRRHSS